jgi:hypothetical protein
MPRNLKNRRGLGLILGSCAVEEKKTKRGGGGGGEV